VLNLVAQLVNFETRMTSISFGRHGCIYFKKDLEKKGLPVYDLDAQVLPSDRKWLNTMATKEFALGPLTEAKLWEDERATMNLKWGPCKLLILPREPFSTNLIREKSSSLCGKHRNQRGTMGEGAC